MTAREQNQAQRPLLLQLSWFIRLRWIAGLTVLLGALVEWKWLRWYGRADRMAAVGAVILAYNGALWFVMRWLAASRRKGSWLLVLAWGQLLLDFGCLTLLTLWTGGIHSALLGFFVFHMVFASLLLPRRMAYAGAAAAMLMVAEGLWLLDRWPVGRQDNALMLGWVATLLMTVWLANRITRSLRRQRRRLMAQNRRIRAMSAKLRRQHVGMIHQEKMAAVGRMAAGVAHEVANPLASMDGLLQLMERRPEKLRPDAIATLREQVSRINQIVRRMTVFAHPGDGNWQTTGLNEVVEKALEVVRFDPRLKDVHIERQLGSNLPPIRMLSESMQQVIVNLVINALDAMEKTPEPRLLIRTTHADRWCCLEITDNGHGIDASAEPHLFEPFFTTKPPGKGTGLGLSISYSLMQSLGGEIRAKNRDGGGATFIVRLPADAQPQPMPAASSAVES